MVLLEPFIGFQVIRLVQYYYYKAGFYFAALRSQ